MTEIEKQHSIDLNNIQEQMKSFFARKQKVKIYHGSTNSTRTQKFEKDKFVDVSRLDRVIEINTKQQYILVEPNVPMDKLVEATLKHFLVPPVVPELPGITVGGSIQGGAGESSSFKYGGVHNCCLQYEIVLENGEVITASPTQNQDLFYGTACSYGSLGIITLVKLRLIPAKDYVQLTYHTVKSFDEAINLTKKKIGESVDFVDGIIFAQNHGVVMVGNFTDKNDLPISTFSKRSDEWFYLHADKISKLYPKYEEIIPIKDYFFRYDRGTFWLGYHALSFFKIPFTKLTRFILDKGLKARALSKVGQATNVSQYYFVQDLSLPKENVLKFLQFVDNELHIYPLWLCPLRPASRDKFAPNCIETDLVINVGVWGEANRGYDNFIRVNRDVENKVRELGGRKVLYAHTYYPREEFWKIYDHIWYNALREKYFANSVFPDIYDKTRVSEKYKPSILVGILKALRSRKIPVS
ncbi:MAG: FAD-binding oxidoreductase [Patescibacteria group bacterium]